MARTEKKSRRAKKDYSSLKAKAKRDKQGGGGDPRFWILPNSEKRVAYTFRFLCSPDQEVTEAYVEHYHHQFEYLDRNGKKKKYYSLCPKTFGKECPICDYSAELFSTNDEDDKKLALKYNKKRKYLTNILVIDDPEDPDRNGKVYMIKMSPQAFTKVLSKIDPDEVDLKKKSYVDFMPYDEEEAGNFYYDFTPASKKNAFPNYDNSEFDNDVCPIAKTDEEIDEIMEKTHNLQKYLDEIEDEKCPSPDAILEKVGHVFDGEGDIKESNGQDDDDDDDDEKETKSDYDDSDDDDDDEKETKKQESRSRKDKKEVKDEEEVKDEDFDDVDDDNQDDNSSSDSDDDDDFSDWGDDD